MNGNVDPDQMLQNAASDLGLLCFLKPSCPNTLSKYGILLPVFIFFIIKLNFYSDCSVTLFHKVCHSVSSVKHDYTFHPR